MQTLHHQKSIRDALALLRSSGGRMALVPTMGALHAGHLALIELAQRHAECVVVSIFVNPLQFGPQEDLADYPRTLERDQQQLIAAGVDLLWAPAVSEMYPDGFATTVSVAGLGDVLCGALRPGHFDGVTTVVTKLFGQIRPDVAVFGEKDWQQLAIIRRLNSDLDLGIEIVGAPIVREEDDLALSSRNAYLSAAERSAAVVLPRTLQAARGAILAGEAVSSTLDAAKTTLQAAGFEQIDYVALVDSDTLASRQTLAPGARIIAAAWLGRTRLIDNMPIMG